MSATLTPSRIARAIAARQWPDIQRQCKIGRGVFGFSCAGHGGIVAVLEHAELSADAIEAARASGFVVDCYIPGTGRTFAAWIGEEDCDWSTILFADDSLRTGAIRGRYLAEDVTREDVERSARDWNPDYVSALTGGPVSAADSYVLRKREWDEAHASHYVTSAAWGDWCDTVPDDYVGISTKRAADGDERYFLVPADEYRGRGDRVDSGPQGKYVADPSRLAPWIGPYSVRTELVAID